MSASVHAGIPHPLSGIPPPGQTPPEADASLEQTPPLEQTPLGLDLPGPDTPLGPDTPPQGPDTPGPDTPPRTRHTPPRDQTPLPPPGKQTPATVNERPVRILLECILVYEKSDKVIISCTSCQINFQLYFLLQISHLKISKHSVYQCIFITARQRSGEGNVFSCVCLLVLSWFYHTGPQPWSSPLYKSPAPLQPHMAPVFPRTGPCLPLVQGPSPAQPKHVQTCSLCSSY